MKRNIVLLLILATLNLNIHANYEEIMGNFSTKVYEVISSPMMGVVGGACLLGALGIKKTLSFLSQTEKARHLNRQVGLAVDESNEADSNFTDHFVKETIKFWKQDKKLAKNVLFKDFQVDDVNGLIALDQMDEDTQENVVLNEINNLSIYDRDYLYTKIETYDKENNTNVAKKYYRNAQAAQNASTKFNEKAWKFRKETRYPILERTLEELTNISGICLCFFLLQNVDKYINFKPAKLFSELPKFFRG